MNGTFTATLAAGAAALLLAGVEAPTGAPDPRRGEALFVGAARLSSGGAPCLACHGVAGHGLARAASFGPDLTASHRQYGADGLDAALADVSFPSMAPIYARHPVTPAERADLAAFLAEVADAPPAALGVRFVAGVMAAAAGFLALVMLATRRGTGRAAARASAAPRRTP